LDLSAVSCLRMLTTTTVAIIHSIW
jgi:hypothetical protein